MCTNTVLWRIKIHNRGVSCDAVTKRFSSKYYSSYYHYYYNNNSVRMPRGRNTRDVMEEDITSDGNEAVSVLHIRKVSM